ncbi:hypothetical protein [Hymenobacter norwichensis]|uniref:hypothetical protein n=1 Tax=Hymenobacter norwichensis TaxID=223903 RepID=UPI0012FA57A6|nr:hypothetical protein [Hymenobacter norwichensis]
MKSIFLLLSGLCITLSGCAFLGMDDCEGARNAYETSFSIQFLDATGTRSIFSPPLSYTRDSVRILDEQGKLVPHVLPTDLTYSAIDFSLLGYEDLVFEKPVTRQFVVYFTRTDQDTIRAEYELLKNKCQDPDFKKLVIFYNSKKVQEGDGRYVVQLSIRKP